MELVKSSRSRKNFRAVPRGRRSQGRSSIPLIRMTGRSTSGAGRQQVVRLEIPGEPVALVTTVTSGLIAFVDVFDPTTDVEDWSTRFVNTFEEYRLLGVNVRLVPAGGGTGAGQSPVGVSKVWFDEKYSSAPVLSESLAKTTYTLSNAASHQQRSNFSWRANDIADEGFLALITAPTSKTAYFKLYTNNANYNSPVVATTLWIYQAFYVLEFRGIEEQ